MTIRRNHRPPERAEVAEQVRKARDAGTPWKVLVSVYARTERQLRRYISATEKNCTHKDKYFSAQGKRVSDEEMSDLFACRSAETVTENAPSSSQETNNAAHRPDRRFRPAR